MLPYKIGIICIFRHYFVTTLQHDDNYVIEKQSFEWVFYYTNTIRGPSNPP